MAGRDRMRERPAGGFVLVGVVMMVIALTIIGLSLYSLSGYETQFFGRSMFDRQALYSGGSGIELVKQLVLSQQGDPATPRLSSAALAIGREGVVSAIAWQVSPDDTSGPVDWARPVHIRVGVREHGVERTVEGAFTASDRESPYHYLLTVPGQLIGIPPGNCDPTGYGRGRVVLGGNAWQNIPPADSGWKSPACFSVSLVTPFMITPAQAPAPGSAEFISAHWGATTAATMVLGSGSNPTNVIDLDAGSGTRYFRSPASDPTASVALRNGFDFVSQSNLKVRVRGTAIWLVPAGIHLSGGLTIERLGENRSTLVIVAGPNGRYVGAQDVGLDFHRGINMESSKDVNVFLVTHGSMVDSEDDNGASDNNTMGRVCIFAQNYGMLPGVILPPGGYTRSMTRQYGTSMRSTADYLLDHDLLPQPVGGTAKSLDLVAGSWTTSPGLP